MKIEPQKSLAIKFLIFRGSAYFVAPANQKHTFCIFKIIKNEQKPLKKQPKSRIADLLLLFIDFYEFWVDFGAQNGPPNDSKSTSKRFKNQIEKCITFLSLLDPSWTGLEAILGPILGSKKQKSIGKRRSA